MTPRRRSAIFPHDRQAEIRSRGIWQSDDYPSIRVSDIDAGLCLDVLRSHLNQPHCVSYGGIWVASCGLDVYVQLRFHSSPHTPASTLTNHLNNGWLKSDGHAITLSRNVHNSPTCHRSRPICNRSTDRHCKLSDYQPRSQTWGGDILGNGRRPDSCGVIR